MARRRAGGRPRSTYQVRISPKLRLKPARTARSVRRPVSAAGVSGAGSPSDGGEACGGDASSAGGVDTAPHSGQTNPPRPASHDWRRQQGVTDLASVLVGHLVGLRARRLTATAYLYTPGVCCGLTITPEEAHASTGRWTGVPGGGLRVPQPVRIRGGSVRDTRAVEATTPAAADDAGLATTCQTLALLVDLAPLVEAGTQAISGEYSDWNAAAGPWIDKVGEISEALDTVPNEPPFREWKLEVLQVILHMSEAVIAYDTGMSGQTVADITAGNDAMALALPRVTAANEAAQAFNGDC